MHEKKFNNQKTIGNNSLVACELEASAQFDIENHKQKIGNIHKDYSNYTCSSCIIFLPNILFTYYSN